MSSLKSSKRRRFTIFPEDIEIEQAPALTESEEEPEPEQEPEQEPVDKAHDVR
jgi:hypothetical protein